MVVAFAGKRRALICGDRRSITFAGRSGELEEDLYAGLIRTDDELRQRAGELGVPIRVEDGRDKVWAREEVLVGEVTEISPSRERRRRVYVTPGAFLLVEVEDGNVNISGRGKSSCLVLGNVLTRSLAYEAVRRAEGRIDEATMRSIMEEAAGKTASVSRSYTVISAEQLQADPDRALIDALLADCAKQGWSLCDQPSS